LSTADSASALKFFDAGTQSFEAEAGLTINEPGTYAVKAAIEMAVVELIKEGQRKSIWDFKSNIPVVVAPPAEKPVVQTPVISSEIRKSEEKKDELVQTQTPKESATAKESLPTAPQQSNDGKVPARVEGKIEATKEKVEAKVEAPKADLKVTAMQTGLKPTVDLFGVRYLKEDSYVYKEANEKSQRTWLLKKGAELYIITPGPEGWHQVRDAEKRKGFVKQEVLIDTPFKEEGKK
jgi:hypothetical protein